MPGVYNMQEERSGQPPACVSVFWTEEKPGTSHPTYVLPALPVLLQVHTHTQCAEVAGFYITASNQRHTYSSLTTRLLPTGCSRGAFLIPCALIASAS